MLQAKQPAFVALDKVSHIYGGAGGTLAVEDLSIQVNRGEFAPVHMDREAIDRERAAGAAVDVADLVEGDEGGHGAV